MQAIGISEYHTSKAIAAKQRKAEFNALRAVATKANNKTVLGKLAAWLNEDI